MRSVLIFLVLALSAVALSQESSKESPTTLELRDLVKQDQTGGRDPGKLSEAERQRLFADDARRRERVAEMLRADLLKTAEDFENAALIFQHGNTSDDYAQAHELYFLSLCMGNFNNGLAISEDRWLLSFLPKQRFGGQFELDGKTMRPVEEGRQSSVTDALRLEFCMPPLKLARAKGPMAVMDVLAEVEASVKQKHNPAWLAEMSKRPESEELMKLAQSSSDEGIGRVLALYQKDGIQTPEDYYNAAQVLARSGDTSELLLAHEFASIAAVHGRAGAKALFAVTFDKVLLSQKLHERYGTQTKAKANKIAPGVLRGLGIGPR